jgi:hypothetical protein
MVWQTLDFQASIGKSLSDFCVLKMLEFCFFVSGEQKKFNLLS